MGSIKFKGVDSLGCLCSFNVFVKNKEKVFERCIVSEKVISNWEKIKRDVFLESVYIIGGDIDNFRGFLNEVSLGIDIFLLFCLMIEDDIIEFYKLIGVGVMAVKKSVLFIYGI